MDKPNRAERRKSKFGGGRSTERGGWPVSRPNPVFIEDPAEAPEPATRAESDEPDTEGEADETPG